MYPPGESQAPILDDKNAMDSSANVSSSKIKYSQQDNRSSLNDENGKRAIKNERDHTVLQKDDVKD
jgi:hypothetical protein